MLEVSHWGSPEPRCYNVHPGSIVLGHSRAALLKDIFWSYCAGSFPSRAAKTYVLEVRRWGIPEPRCQTIYPGSIALWHSRAALLERTYWKYRHMPVIKMFCLGDGTGQDQVQTQATTASVDSLVCCNPQGVALTIEIPSPQAYHMANTWANMQMRSTLGRTWPPGLQMRG